MENKVDWKVGDRVVYVPTSGNTDTGVVTDIRGNKVWVKWDSDGLEKYFLPEYTEFFKVNSEPIDESAETKAVTLLLSLGYTLKKGV
jgi:hypothetical protein